MIAIYEVNNCLYAPSFSIFPSEKTSNTQPTKTKNMKSPENKITPLRIFE